MMHTAPREFSAAPWPCLLANARTRLNTPVPLECSGTLQRVAGWRLEASGLRVEIGTQCWIDTATGSPALLAEVVGFAGEQALLMPAGDTRGLAPGARITPVSPRPGRPTCAREAPAPQLPGILLPVGEGLLTRVLDAMGQPLDGRPAPTAAELAPLHAAPINAMQRAPLATPLDVGVRAINALLSVARGQRLGLFAAAGGGKSTLLGMMAQHTAADIIIVGLVGERGREVQEFVQDILPADRRRRAVVVAAPADAPPLLRVQAAHYASRLAEHFRDRGQHVLLLMDSATRYAQAQREMALGLGEMPASKGYPPSALAKLSALIERSGNAAPGGGSITALYTVLTEGEGWQDDPVAEAARAILDGHITLSRELAESGHWPAIDIGQSLSRAMHRVASPAHQALAQRFRQMYARQREVADLLRVGAYVPGNDPQADEALARQPAMQAFLRQETARAADFAGSLAALEAALRQGENP